MPRFCAPLASAIGLVATLFAPPVFAQTPVPYTLIQIKGTQDADDGMTFTYRAYRNGTDPFRVICSEPCAANQNAIYGLYAGFATVYQTIVGLFGVPPVAAAQPFDLHVDEDHWCGPALPGIGGDSQLYSVFPWSGLTTGSYGCFWFTDPGHAALPFQYPDTAAPSYHLITAHEFTHTMFFVRHLYSYEDFAKAISFYITGPGATPATTDPCDDKFNELLDGKLLWNLCHRNAFQYGNLAPAFTALANTFTNGHGQGANGTTTVSQFRAALSNALGSDTTDAFLAAKSSTLPLTGDNGTLPYGGGRATGVAGWVSFLVPVNALTSNFPFHLDGTTLTIGPAGHYVFENIWVLSGRGANPPLHFDDPIYTQFRYDRSLLNFGTDESTLRLYRFESSSIQLIADSRVDPSRMIVSGAITAPGSFVLSATSNATVAPSLVVARAVSNGNTHTRLVLRNPYFDHIDGTITLHPQGVPASPSDPSMTYSLDYSKTLILDDVVAALGGAAGTVDITSTNGNLPDAQAIGVETGSSTYPGAIIPVWNAAAALQTGERGVLTAPGNLQKENWGFVVRTFGGGVEFTVTARDAAGTVLATTPFTYGANTMVQVSEQAFAGGTTLQASESFDITVQAGSAIIMTEERGQGMSSHLFRLAERVDLAASTDGDALHLPRAVSVTNGNGTTLRTSLQLTNVSTSTITGHVRFKPADGSATAGFNYSIAPGGTKTYSDVVGAVGKTGGGALDVTSTSGNLPIAFSRLIYSGAATPWQVATESASANIDMLVAGDRAVIVAPATANQDFRIGVRTLTRDLAVTIRIHDTSGFQTAKITKTFAAGTAFEDTVANVLGTSLTSGQIVQIQVDGGAGIVYGSSVNTATGAVNLQLARRLPYY